MVDDVIAAYTTIEGYKGNAFKELSGLPSTALAYHLIRSPCSLYDF